MCRGAKWAPACITGAYPLAPSSRPCHPPTHPTPPTSPQPHQPPNRPQVLPQRRLLQPPRGHLPEDIHRRLHEARGGSGGLGGLGEGMGWGAGKGFGIFLWGLCARRAAGWLCAAAGDRRFACVSFHGPGAPLGGSAACRARGRPHPFAPSSFLPSQAHRRWRRRWRRQQQQQQREQHQRQQGLVERLRRLRRLRRRLVERLGRVGRRRRQRSVRPLSGHPRRASGPEPAPAAPPWGVGKDRFWAPCGGPHAR
jgi:hypothetical protein